MAVGEDSLLHRGDASIPPPRVRAAAAGRPPRPPPPARAALQLPPRPGGCTHLSSLHLPPRPRRVLRRRAGGPGEGVPLRVLARRPPRGVRGAVAPHPLRLHGRRRGRRGVQVGRCGVQRGLAVLCARQGCCGVWRRGCGDRVAREGTARRRRGHVPHVARARRRAPRHGVPRVVPREAAHARLQNRRRSGKTKGRPDAQVTEAIHGMTV